MIHEYRFEIFGSILLHAMLVAVLAAAPSCATPTPKEKVTIIKAVSLATVKKSKLPTKASRAPRENSAVPKQEVSTIEKPKPPEMKTKPDQMVVKKEKKEKEKEKPKEKQIPAEKPTEQKKEEPKQTNRSAREELMRKMAREKALESLQNAPEGTVDREETSQEGSETSTSGTTGVGPTDPILSAYVEASRNAILPNWTPLPSLIASHPEYEVVLKVNVAADGTMTNPKIIKKSGDSSFDRAAIMAIHKTGKIPAPPEKWKKSAAAGIMITLAAKDK